MEKLRSTQKLGTRTARLKRNPKPKFQMQGSLNYITLLGLVFISGGVAVLQGGVWIAVLIYVINLLALLLIQYYNKK